MPLPETMILRPLRHVRPPAPEPEVRRRREDRQEGLTLALFVFGIVLAVLI